MTGPLSESFDDLEVVPYSQLFSPTVTDIRGGPLYPDFSNRNFERHCRFGSPIDRISEDDVSARRPRTLGGAFVWAGPIVGHYGHQIAEFSHRLVQSQFLEKHTQVLVATRGINADNISTVNSHWMYRKVSDLPPFVRATLEWSGIGLDRVVIVTEPIRVARLSVFAQGEQLGTPAHSWYLDLLDDRSQSRERITETNELIFVSRAGLRFGRIAGESYLESFFFRSGAAVIRPEELELERQLDLYRTAKHVIFSEGSAIHTLGMLGRGLGRITILQRRADYEHVWRAQVEPRTSMYESINAIQETFPHTRHSTGMTCLDPVRLVESLTKMSLPQRADFSLPDFQEAVMDDLSQFRADLADRRFNLGVERHRIAHEQSRILEFQLSTSPKSFGRFIGFK